MSLPNADQAIVDPAKVRDYLLSPTHTIGRSKARFFAAIGFQQDDSAAFAAALLALAVAGEARAGKPSSFGAKYEVRGILAGSLGAAAIVTVWIVLTGEDRPRLVTAYPEDDQ